MNITKWRALFFTTINSVYYSDTSWINVHDLPKGDFPVLHLLEDLSTLEVLLLAWLIITRNDNELGGSEQTFSFLVDVFDKLVFTPDEFEASLGLLMQNGWVQSFVDASRAIYYKADFLRLQGAGLLTSLWDLGELGLYKNLSSN
ncbi:hypothetical protein V9K67_10085 [Paraflavisolibacter sp. H34]|uniref:hypothetical protein n=1 Tax=Huijunlia imazamoxiresistens TaxID=3127457 RepID=UPI00301A6479